MEHTASKKKQLKQCQYCHSLGKGSKVEVWSEEDGFSNAWFSAEILQPPRSTHGPSGRKRKRTATAVVKYHHMLSVDDDGGGPLIERIKTSFIRPVPPPDSPLDRPFELYEVVDAFYTDTWWTGFVVKVVGDTYTVAFKRPLDLQEFRRSDLRLHWDWVDSKWVRPDKEETTGLIYIPGTEVEVNRHNESPCNAWLQAVIIGQVGPISFLVKYKSSDSGEAGLKQETVDLEQIRPYPPEMKVATFNVLEKVDVFHDSYWWAGVITKLLEGKRYIVTLRHKKKMEFSHSELRPHLEWIDGQWIRHTPYQSSGTLDDTERERPCLSGKQCSPKVLSPGVEKTPYLGDSKMKKENHISSGDKVVELIQIGDDKITNQQEVGETKNQVVSSAKKRGRQRKSHESLGSIMADTKKERPCLGNKQGNQKEEKLPYLGSSNMEKENHLSSSDKPAEVIPNAADKIITQQEVGERENQAVVYAKKRGRRWKSRESSGSTLDDTKKERSSSKKQDNKKELTPYVENSAYSRNLNMEKENHNSSSDKPAEVIPNGDDKITKQQEVGETKTQAVRSARRGEIPQKAHESSGSISDETEKERSCSGEKQDSQKEFSPRVEKSPNLGSSNVEKENLNSSSDKPAEVPNGDDKNGQNSDTEMGSALKGNGEHREQVVANIQAAAAGEELCGAGGVVIGCTTEISKSPVTIEVILTEEDGATPASPMTRIISSDDQALVLHAGETHAPTNADESGKLNYKDTTEEDVTLASPQALVFRVGETHAPSNADESGKLNYEDTMEEDGVTLASPQALVLHVGETHIPTNADDSGDIVRKDVLNLPFVKSYPIWEIIESMEVFKKLPQNPHFQPLMKYKEVKREGAALGLMMNFASLVEKISKLQEDNSREDFESIMEELDELEELGFDINVVRGRVSELLRVKVMLESFVDESNGVETEIHECADAKTKIDEEVADIDEELKRLQEKRTVLLSESVAKGYQEMKLISKARVINEGISSTRERFRSLVETPW